MLPMIVSNLPMFGQVGFNALNPMGKLGSNRPYPLGKFDGKGLDLSLFPGVCGVMGKLGSSMGKLGSNRPFPLGNIDGLFGQVRWLVLPIDIGNRLWYGLLHALEGLHSPVSRGVRGAITLVLRLSCHAPLSDAVSHFGTPSARSERSFRASPCRCRDPPGLDRTPSSTRFLYPQTLRNSDRLRYKAPMLNITLRLDAALAIQDHRGMNRITSSRVAHHELTEYAIANHDFAALVPVAIDIPTRLRALYLFEDDLVKAVGIEHVDFIVSWRIFTGNAPTDYSETVTKPIDGGYLRGDTSALAADLYTAFSGLYGRFLAAGLPTPEEFPKLPPDPISGDMSSMIALPPDVRREVEKEEGMPVGFLDPENWPDPKPDDLGITGPKEG